MRVEKILSSLLASVALSLALGVVAYGQTEAVASAETEKTTQQTENKKSLAPLTQLKGIELGMTGKEVKKKFGDPKIDDEDGYYYVFSDTETMQVRLDDEQKVNVISMTYSGKNATAPEYTEVFGPEAKARPDASGQIHKLVRYPDSGYWISYSRIMLDSGPMTTITMQKIRKFSN